MAKFCSKCGKLTEECVCQKETKKSVKKSAVTNQGVVNNIISMIKEVFKKPFDCVSDYIALGNTKFSLLLILIQSLLFGLFCYFIANNAIKATANSVSSSLSSLGTLGALTGSTVSSQMQNIQLPFLSILLCGTIVMFLGYIVLSLMAKLFMGVIFKVNFQVKEYLNLHGIVSIIPSIVMVAAIILSFISLKVAMLALVIGIILYFVTVVQCYIEIVKVKADRLSYSAALTILATYIISVWVGFFVIGCFLASYYYSLY